MKAATLKRVHVGMTSTASGNGISVNLAKYPLARKWVIEMVVDGEAHAIPIDEAVQDYKADGAPEGAVTLHNVVGYLGMKFD